MARLPRRRRREPEDLPQLLSDDALIAWGRVLNRVPDRDWHDDATKKAEPEAPAAVEPAPVPEPEPEPVLELEPLPEPEPIPEPEPVQELPSPPEPEPEAPRPAPRLRATRRPGAWPPAGDVAAAEPEPESLEERPLRRAPLRAAEPSDARRRAPLVARGRRTAPGRVNGTPAAVVPERSEALRIPDAVTELPPLELPDARLSPMGERLRARLSQIDDD